MGFFLLKSIITKKIQKKLLKTIYDLAKKISKIFALKGINNLSECCKNFRFNQFCFCSDNLIQILYEINIRLKNNIDLIKSLLLVEGYNFDINFGDFLKIIPQSECTL